MTPQGKGDGQRVLSTCVSKEVNVGTKRVHADVVTITQ